MKTDIKDIGKSQKEILISLSPKEMEPFLDKAANRLAKDMKIKGFREGHIPRNIVEGSVGKDRVWQEASGEIIEEKYIDILETQKISPIGRPQVSVLKLVPGNNFEFKIVIPVMPEVVLPDYREIAKKYLSKHQEKVSITDKEVEDALKWLQKTRGESDTDKDKKTKPQELDDKFAQSLGDFKTLEDLKKSVKEGLLQEKEQKQKQRARLEILDEIEKKIDLEIPEILIQEELDKMQRELEQQAESLGMSLEKYLENAKQTLQTVRAGWESTAKNRIANTLILRLIADKENIEPDEGEIEERVNKYLSQFSNTEEAQKDIDPEYLRLYIRGIIKNEKVFAFLEDENHDN